MLKNTEIRETAKMKNVYLHEVAGRLGISEPTMTRKLRHELERAEKEKLLSIIDEIASEREGV
ncbi:MAG: hypothetical protein IJ457_07155 [Clostridia bacterium]|nr:hypothetical protein [Clostridia bacterium]